MLAERAQPCTGQEINTCQGTTRERVNRDPAAACLWKEYVLSPRVPAQPSSPQPWSAPVLPCEYCCFLWGFPHAANQVTGLSSWGLAVLSLISCQSCLATQDASKQQTI